MGFKDANWAYDVGGLTAPQKAVLVAVCHATDDKTHKTLIGQENIASRTSLAVDTVGRALRHLEKVGALGRRARHGQQGYRTSDEITVDTTYTALSLEGAEPGRPTAHQADIPDLPDSHPGPTRLGAGAEEVNQISTSGQPDVAPKPSKRGTRIPEPFTVTDAMKQWAAERTPLVDLDRSTRRFIDYWRAKPGQGGVKLDWTATWRNWIDRDQETAEKNPRLTPMDRARQTLALAPGGRIELTPEQKQLIA